MIEQKYRVRVCLLYDYKQGRVLQNPIASCLKYLVMKFHHYINASDGFNVSETVRTLKTKNINGVLKLWTARN
ncbi:unnamed protein product [Heligmosomoides polygyrus]|uniref:CRISPR-associated endonuclease Cas2 n=1 Tax=Heligmosomoides polygyrus TaxID=6339 RepID=A0A183G323_HELPZ|nr:unnamed protein product [Heligmosomoides polygyrus]